MKTTLDRFDRVNVLVNNAGGMSVRKRPERCTSAEWHSLIDTNLTSAFDCCQAAAFPVIKRGGASQMISPTSLLFSAALGPITSRARSFRSTAAIPRNFETGRRLTFASHLTAKAHECTARSAAGMKLTDDALSPECYVDGSWGRRCV